LGTRADFWTVDDSHGISSRMTRYDQFVFSDSVNQMLSRVFDLFKTQVTRLSIGTQLDVVVRDPDLDAPNPVAKQIYCASPHFLGKCWQDWA
jgi:hypothetical protein